MDFSPYVVRSLSRVARVGSSQHDALRRLHPVCRTVASPLLIQPIVDVQPFQNELDERRANPDGRVSTSERGSQLVGQRFKLFRQSANRIRGCDAVYVALAEALDEPLVTFDEQQAARAAGVVRVLRPGE